MDRCASMIDYVLKRQRNFDFNYYLTKNCPMPANWPEKKAKYLEMSKQDQK